MNGWLTVAEALKEFGFSRPTLYRLINKDSVRRAKRAGDFRIYVNAADLRKATALRPLPPKRRA